jgi:eukaryotic-like serine/threonine-protein kinase
MDSDRWELVKKVFFDALDQSERDRAAFLDATCAGDSKLRGEVEALLRAHGLERGSLESRFITDEETQLPVPDALIGRRIGPYRVIRLIGSGGMGAVYLAERDDDFTQQVALKLIRPDLHSAEVIRRFRTERQILANLQHPGIARLLDGGMTEEGLPYLVMEFVDGSPITAYCDANRLPVTERLRLFRDVCSSVQYAHRNLVVHRDLKPSNIFVTESGEVKLLDFGIAKLLDASTPDSSAPRTRFDMRMLTPEYAAPEQVRGESITTATDVYTLGVVLYELLTGRRPFRLPERLQAEVERLICEETPALPSTAVTSAEEIVRADGTTEILQPEAVSAARRTQIVRLRRSLRGDLDNVVMMALRKEPERRYTSVEQIAEDIGRHLSGRPVIARRDTLAYRSLKFVRRNRVGVSVVAGFVLLLTAFSVLTVSQARRIADERDRAEHVSAFLASVFSAANPVEAQGDTLTALELLDRGAARIDAELGTQSAARADLLDVMSGAYLARGAAARAEMLARQAVELRRDAGSANLPRSLTHLADALQAQSRFAEADSLFRLVANHHRAKRDLPELISALERRGQFLISSLSPLDSVAAVFDEVLALRRRHLGTEDPGHGRALILYANGYHVRGDYKTAERLFRQALDQQERGSNDLAVMAEAQVQLGVILSFRREYAEADSLLKEAVRSHERVFGRQHPATATALGYYGLNLTSLARFDEAEPVLRESLSIHREYSGPESMDYLASLRTLRKLLSDTGRHEEAVHLGRDVVHLTAKLYGADSRSYATNLAHYAQVLHNAARPADALPEYRAAVALLHTHLGPDAPFHAMMQAEMARCLEDLNRAEEAEALYAQAYAVMKERLGTESFERSRVAYKLGRFRLSRGDHTGALPLFEDAANVRVGDSRASAEVSARASFALGWTLLVLDRRDEAAPYLQASEMELRRLLGPEHEESREATRLLATIR